MTEDILEEIMLELEEQLIYYENLDLELFFSFVDFADYNLSEIHVGDILGKLSECFHGRYDSEEEYATMLINECYKLPEFERKYFDYETYCRDLFSTICYYDKKTKAVFSYNY